MGLNSPISRRSHTVARCISAFVLAFQSSSNLKKCKCWSQTAATLRMGQFSNWMFPLFVAPRRKGPPKKGTLIGLEGHASKRKGVTVCCSIAQSAKRNGPRSVMFINANMQMLAITFASLSYELVERHLLQDNFAICGILG